MADVEAVASEDGVFAVTAAVGSVTPAATVEGGRVWFANETAWIGQLEFASGCAGVASAVAAGLIDDAVDVVSAYEKGPIRDAVASGVVAILAQAELWSAEMPVIEELQELTRRFIAGIRDRELLTRPRIVLEHEEKDV